MQLLSEAAEQARAATDRQFAQQMGMTPTPEVAIVDVTTQAMNLLAQTHPSYGGDTQTLLAEELSENPGAGGKRGPQKRRLLKNRGGPFLISLRWRWR